MPIINDANSGETITQNPLTIKVIPIILKIILDRLDNVRGNIRPFFIIFTSFPVFVF